MAKKTLVGNHGSTGAVATGTAVNHGCGAAPSAVLLTAKATGASDIYADTITGTQFTVHFAGGGARDFYFTAIVP